MLRNSTAKVLQFKGSSLEALGNEAGKGFQNAAEQATASIQERFPKVTEARIQGTKPHASSKDPQETQNVVTIGYHTATGTRALSIHVREDGTWKEFLSRAGRK